jgi:hypothetical protein
VSSEIGEGERVRVQSIPADKQAPVATAER